MRINKPQLCNLISALFEGKRQEHFISQKEGLSAYVLRNPESIREMENLQISDLSWIERTGNVHEALRLVVKLRSPRISSQMGSLDISREISDYTLSSLKETLDNLPKSREAKKIEDTKKIGEWGPWLVVMPLTKDSSCLWGKGTKWCTSSEEGTNSFEPYMTSELADNILFYLINREKDSIEDPESKLSIGFINGRPSLEGIKGGLTVDARNIAINEKKIKNILGDYYEEIMNAMKNEVKSLRGKHPLKIRKNLSESVNSLVTSQEVSSAISRALQILNIGDKNFYDFLVRISRVESGTNPSGLENITHHTKNFFQLTKIAVQNIQTNPNMRFWREYIDSKKSPAPIKLSKPISQLTFSEILSNLNLIALFGCLHFLFVLGKKGYSNGVLWKSENRSMISQWIPKDIKSQAILWKKEYNTELGDGHPNDFIRKSGVQNGKI